MVKKILFMLLVISVSLAEIDFRKELQSLNTIGSLKFDKDEKADLILIDFWASWCDPCKESFPYYDKKIKEQKKKVLFISVNMDDKIEKAEDFLKKFPLNHITVWDENRKLMELLGFDSVPFMVILDKDWNVKEKIKGFNERTKKRVAKYL